LIGKNFFVQLQFGDKPLDFLYADFATYDESKTGILREKTRRYFALAFGTVLIGQYQILGWLSHRAGSSPAPGTIVLA
jgi:hypothetical protein